MSLLVVGCVAAIVAPKVPPNLGSRFHFIQDANDLPLAEFLSLQVETAKVGPLLPIGSSYQGGLFASEVTHVLVETTLAFNLCISSSL